MIQFVEMHPTFFLIAAGFVIGGGTLLYQIAGWKHRVDNSITDIQNSIADIQKTLIKILDRLGKLEGNMSRLEGKMVKLEGNMSRLEGNMGKMEGKMVKLEGKLSLPVSSTQSPVQLTDFGHKISATAKAAKWAEEHAPKMVKAASGKEEFKVFKLCAKYVQKQYDAKSGNLQDKIDHSAYEHGIDEDQVRQVFKIELRDKLLGLTRKKQT